MPGYTADFWHTFERDFEKSSEERSESHNRNRQSLHLLEVARLRKLKEQEEATD